MIKAKTYSLNMNKDYEGYMTLEATLLMPFVLMSLFFLLYMGFYRYDACLTKQDACIIAVCGEIPWRREVAHRYVKDAMSGRYPEKYLSYSATRTEEKTEEGSVTVSLAGRVVVPIGGVFFVRGKERMVTEATVEAKRLKSVEFVRNCRKLEGIIRAVTG